jgi:hypothetical protein
VVAAPVLALLLEAVDDQLVHFLLLHLFTIAHRPTYHLSALPYTTSPNNPATCQLSIYCSMN